MIHRPRVFHRHRLNSPTNGLKPLRRRRCRLIRPVIRRECEPFYRPGVDEQVGVEEEVGDRRDVEDGI